VVAKGSRGDDIIYEFYFRRPLIGANTHSATAVNRHNNVTILSHLRRRRPIYFLFCRSGDKYILCRNGANNAHSRTEIRRSSSLSVAQHRGSSLYSVFSVNMCMYVCMLVIGSER